MTVEPIEEPLAMRTPEFTVNLTLYSWPPGGGQPPVSRQLLREAPRGGTHPFRLRLGRIVATAGALEALAVALLQAHPTPSGIGLAARYLLRHAMGDWGDLDAEDRAANERAVTAGERILSACRLPGGETIWIITEADRSVTTLLLPLEY